MPKRGSQGLRRCGGSAQRIPPIFYRSFPKGNDNSIILCDSCQSTFYLHTHKFPASFYKDLRYGQLEELSLAFGKHLLSPSKDCSKLPEYDSQIDNLEYLLKRSIPACSSTILRRQSKICWLLGQSLSVLICKVEAKLSLKL